MNGAQALVGFGGAGLVFANFWLGGGGADKNTVAEGLFSSSNNGGTAEAHSVLLKLGGEMLLVVVMTVLAGAFDGVGTVMVIAVIGLWVLWAMNHFGSGTTTTSSKGSTLA